VSDRSGPQGPLMGLGFVFGDGVTSSECAASASAVPVGVWQVSAYCPANIRTKTIRK
jgi:hypothetical protein